MFSYQVRKVVEERLQTIGLRVLEYEKAAIQHVSLGLPVEIASSH